MKPNKEYMTKNKTKIKLQYDVLEALELLAWHQQCDIEGAENADDKALLELVQAGTHTLIERLKDEMA